MKTTAKKPPGPQLFGSKFPYNVHGSARTTDLPGVRVELDDLAAKTLACKLDVPVGEIALTRGHLHDAFLDIVECVVASELEGDDLLRALQDRIREGEQARTEALPAIWRKSG